MSSVLDPLDTSFRGVTDRVLEALGAGADANPGSVIRTIVEAFAREMATFYAMLDRAHRAGYVDTATGAALDSVVALLGIERARAGRLRGTIELSRTSPSPHDINISAGFRVTGELADGSMLPLFETVEDVVLSAGTTRVLVEIQELEGSSRGDTSAIPSIGPHLLTMTPRPALGIESVTNLQPLTRSSADESDAHLRARARVALRQSQRGTLESIRAAVLEQGVKQVEVCERSDGPPGVIEVLIGDREFERDLAARERIATAIRGNKAAGVRVQLRFLRTVFVQPVIALWSADPELDERGFQALSVHVQRSLARHVAALPSERSVSRRKLEAVMLATPGVGDVELRELRVFTVAPEPAAPTDASRLVVTPRGGDTTLTVHVGRSERASIDTERWPPVVVREHEPVRQVDVVVQVDRDDVGLRARVRGALEELARGYQGYGNRGEQRLRALLEKRIKDAGGLSLLLAVVTTEHGAARVLDGSETLTHPRLAGEATLVIGGVDFVTEGGEVSA